MYQYGCCKCRYILCHLCVDCATVLLPNSSVEMSPADNEGPFTILYEKNADYLLWFAWTFIIICISHVFFTSQVGKHAVERVYILWQEHQHQHMD